MSKPILMLQECGTLNRVFAAFFMNECYVKDGVNFEDSKPTMQNISCLNEGRYFTQDDRPAGLKRWFHGRVDFENIDMNKFRSVGIYDFFETDMKDKISDLAKEFAGIVAQTKYCDFVFSDLPDAAPYVYDCILDPETNFRCRLIIGKDFSSENYNASWEFYCLLMARFREVERHPIYGASYKDVDYMSNEDLDKYNKQPESE